MADKILTPLQNRKKIMFVCRENVGRSQMAAAFAKNLAGSLYDVFSAGSQPAEQINPVVVAVMAEKGCDIAFNEPCSIEYALKCAGGTVMDESEDASVNAGEDATVNAGAEPAVNAGAEPAMNAGEESAVDVGVNIMVTMGCGEQCPFIPECKMIDWDLPDPAGKSIDEVRSIRDEIEQKVQTLLT